MTNVLIFDLDNTLAPTKKLEDVRTRKLDWDQVPAETLNTIRPYKGVQEMLDGLVAAGVTLAIVTNSPRRYCEPLLEHLGLADYFHTVVAYDDVGPIGIKPSPNGINLALKKLNKRPSKRIFYFGDEPSDIAASYCAGVSPAVGSWSTRTPIDGTPALVMSTSDVLDYFASRQNLEKYSLIAERYANLAQATGEKKISKDDYFYLGLNENGHCVTARRDMQVLALGRYFTQKSLVTAALHDQHLLSIDIEKKSKQQQFEIPGYWIDLLSETIARFQKNGFSIDVTTVIPGKVGGDNRMERLLIEVRNNLQKADPRLPSAFVPDIFEFNPGAQSLKTLNYDQREVAIRESLQIKRPEAVAGKSILVIDDVTTSGATLRRARDLLQAAGALNVWGAVIAKSVSMPADFLQCPKCGRLMKVRKNKDRQGRFWGCTGYFEIDSNNKRACNHVVHIS